jgi:Ca2+-binding RTX toxin-like protein
VNLGFAGAQVVNAGLTLTLSSDTTIENVIGGALGDTITGNALNNSLSGGSGNDTLAGGAGNDILTGGAGDDLLIGGDGNDKYSFDTDLALGSDTIDESGGGIDTLDFSATTTRAVSINLGNPAAQVVNAGLTLTLSSGTTIENVTGGALGDTITGNALNNSLSSGAGNDTLDGGAGTDTLDGGAGTDVATNGEVLINIP